MMFPSAPRRAILVAAAALVALELSGCASRSLNTPPVIERSAELRPAPKAGASLASAFYTVKRGNTIFSIANQFGTSARDLAAWNNLDAGMRIHVDQVLRVQPPDEAPVATAQPVGSAAVEQRPIGAPGAATIPPASAAAAAAASVPLKSGPSGVKRPYSEVALAEMSKPDVAATTAPVASPTIPAASAAPETPKPAENSADETPITWAWPAPGKLVETFSEGKSKGIAIAGKAGDAVLAAADGRVLYVGSGVRGYGNLVIVKHNANIVSVYAHNRAILVKEHDAVKKGQKIAEMGNSDADQVKLHFEIRNLGKPVDPQKFLPEH